MAVDESNTGPWGRKSPLCRPPPPPPPKVPRQVKGHNEESGDATGQPVPAQAAFGPIASAPSTSAMEVVVRYEDRNGEPISKIENAPEEAKLARSHIAPPKRKDHCIKRLLRNFPVVWYGTVLGLSSQALLWKSMATAKSMSWANIPIEVSYAMWGLGLLWFLIVTIVYMIKSCADPCAMISEMHHPVRVNFFFAPVIITLFLLISTPFDGDINDMVYEMMWWMVMGMNMVLILRLYGQWWWSEKSLSIRKSNPTYQIAVVANFVGATAGSIVGLTEPAKFFFAIGILWELMLFVNVYSTMHGDNALAKPLRPVLFLWIAPPSAAATAWGKVNGWDSFSDILFFLGLFFYIFVFGNISRFCCLKFSLAWWACTFPMTANAIAFIDYANHNTTVATQVLSFAWCLFAMGAVTVMIVLTSIHLIIGKMFPHDPVPVKCSVERKRTLKFIGKKRVQDIAANKTPDEKIEIEAEVQKVIKALTEAPNETVFQEHQDGWGLPDENLEENTVGAEQAEEILDQVIRRRVVSVSPAP